MFAILQNLMDSPIAWTVLAFLAIFSTVFAVYTWIASKTKKQFSFSCKTNEIIVSGKSNIDKLKIKYDGQDISDLSSSRFYIWNSGNKVINIDDVVISKPLCIINTGDAKILDAQIIKYNEETNNFAVTQMSDTRIKLSFDYVDHGEGLILQVLHTGSSKDLELNCKIKGGKKIVDRSVIERKKSEPIVQQVWDFICDLLPTLLSFCLCGLSIKIVEKIRVLLGNVPWIGIVISFLIMIAAFLLGLLAGTKTARAINERLHRSIPSSLLE